jgi:hypothetical protein
MPTWSSHDSADVFSTGKQEDVMTDEDEDRTPIPQPEVERTAKILEATLGDEFAGHSVRVDAGERGRVWIALRDALGDEDAERVTTERIEQRFDEIGLEERDTAYRVSAGASGDDLVLLCELWQKE